MSWVSFTALFFATWWIVLFVVLPFSVRTQDDDHDVAVLMGIFYGLTKGLGYSLDEVPHIIPEFSQTPTK